MRLKETLPILIGLLLTMNSCIDDELHSITVQIHIVNATQRNLHCFYNENDLSLSDSIYQVLKNQTDSSLYDGGIMQFGIDTIISRDDVLSESEFSELISKFKIFYIENQDTFEVNNQFYDGKTYWKSGFHRETDGIMFIKHYWWCEYTATLTADMFEKR